MKKIFLLFFSLFALAVISGCGNAAKDSQAPAAVNGAAENEKVLRAGCTGQSFPNSYMDNGKLVGFDVEVLNTAAGNLGYKVEWTTIDFAGVMGQLDSGKLDTVANAVSITPVREEKYVFTQPYSHNGTQFVTRKDNDQINKVEDLFGKTVSGVAGSNHLKSVAKVFPNGEINIRTYETRDGAQNDLINGRVDGYVNARAALIAEIKKGDLPLKLVGNPIVLSSEGFPFSKTTDRGKKLREEFNAELGRMKENGTLKNISLKYFNEDITKPAE